MTLRFKTRDGLTVIDECRDVDEPLRMVMRPMWNGYPTAAGIPNGFMHFRHYEFRGEVEDGIPTVHEVCAT